MQLLTNASANQACLGSYLNFNCSVGSANPPVIFYQLLKNNVVVETSNSGMWIRILPNSGLFTYKCLVNNTLGTADSTSVIITVGGKYYIPLRYQPPFSTVRARIAVALVVFIKTPIDHIFFKSLIIPDYGFELAKTIYLNVFRNWNALCKSTCLYKSCSTPAGDKRKKTINTAFASQHVPLKNRVSDF